MKTQMIMQRELLGFTVRQNHKTGMFNANDLHSIGNNLREAKGRSEKQLSHYFGLPDTIALMEELCFLDNVEFNDIKKATRGKNGGTWVSPELFVDLAMWYSPELKARILKWVVDNLLFNRDDSGESFKLMNNAMNKHFSKECDDPRTYMRIALQISNACKVGAKKDKWQTANDEQLKLRSDIQKTASIIAEFCASSSDCISRAINKNI